MSFLSHFFQLTPLTVNAPDVIYGTYNLKLVALSYIIAVFASFVALDFAGCLRVETNKRMKIYWLLGGAFAMGAGIWSMHFIGMLAFILPMPMRYNPYVTALSMLVVVLSSLFALSLLQNKHSYKYLGAGGIILGLGIASMHYTGMSAMLGMSIRYIPSIFMLSVLIAIVASEAALWLMIKSNQGSYKQQLHLKMLSALIMGAAICGMHYTGMFAAVFRVEPGMLHTQVGIDTYTMAFTITGITGIILTIALIVSTYKQLMLGAMQNEKYFLNAVLDNLSNGIMACDAKGRITVMNQAFQTLINPSSMETVDKKNTLHFSFHQPNNAMPVDPKAEPIRRALQGEILNNEEYELVLKKNALKRYVIINGQPILTNEGEILGAVIAINDITEQKKLEGQLIFQATHDPLTQLPNRLLLLDRIKLALIQAKRDQKQVAIVFLDLDKFKLINDNCGHDEGDKLLLTVAKRLKRCVREGDTVSRLGGDEFIILLTELEKQEHSLRILNAIEEAMSEPFIINDQPVNITASMGVSLFPGDAQHAEILIKYADIAMYRAKIQGRNTFSFYTEEMNVNNMKRMEKEQALHVALKGNQFVLHYQPVFDMKTNIITGVEALIRWEHPVLGIIAPLEFIPLAEETGEIIPIGKWVLETACEQSQLWREQGIPPLHMGVNVSGKQFNQPDFVRIVKETLDRTQLPPEFLELELTESVVLERPEQTILALRELKSMGIQIALDDFGTGYSSLGYLAQLPINKIKIDRSFVQNIESQEKKSTIVMAVIGMASSLKLKVTAEGAETENEMSFLRFNRCDEAQGFYLCYPLNAEDCTVFLREHFKLSKKP